jgi:E3 ubiquitin-protein ligase HUWE1
MIIYGLPFINLDDWINNTEYKGAYYKNHQTIKWFWNTVKTFDQ